MNSTERRKILIEEMESLDSKGINCVKCPGFCCTYERNSMLITPAEAQDIYAFLKSQQKWDKGLRIKLQENIKNYRLDSPLPSNGKRSYLRRTYTCPFFGGQNLGCELPKEVKPYGCLGYNPSQKYEVLGLSCQSNQSLLEKRELDGQSTGEKEPIPVALLRLFQEGTT